MAWIVQISLKAKSGNDTIPPFHTPPPAFPKSTPIPLPRKAMKIRRIGTFLQTPVDTNVCTAHSFK